jgi:hypothetical protein
VKKQLTLLTAFFVIVLGCSAPSRVSSQNKKAESQATPSATESPAQAAQAVQAMKRLRERLLTSSAEELGLSGKDAKAKVYGILMEIGFSSGASTVVSIGDGTASLYTSTGGGVLGGYSARKEAKRFVAQAAKHLAGMKSTKSFPYPQAGRIKFYVLTREGVYTDEADENQLVGGQHALSPLFFAGNDVLTGLRIASERVKPSGKP